MYKEFDDIQNNENVKLAEAYLKNIPIIDVPNWTKELANNQPAINSSIIMLGKAMTAVMSEWFYKEYSGFMWFSVGKNCGNTR